MQYNFDKVMWLGNYEIFLIIVSYFIISVILLFTTKILRSKIDPVHQVIWILLILFFNVVGILAYSLFCKEEK